MADEDICQNIALGDCSKSDGNLREFFNSYPSFNNPFKLHNEKYLKLAALLNDPNIDQEINDILEQDDFNREDEFYQEFQSLEEKHMQNNQGNIIEKVIIERKISQQLIDEYFKQFQISKQLFGLIYSNKNNQNFGHFLIMKNQPPESIEQVQSENEFTLLFKENDLTKLCAILGQVEYFNDEKEKQVIKLSLNGQFYLLKFDVNRGLVSCQEYKNGTASLIVVQDITVKHFEGVRYVKINK